MWLRNRCGFLWLFPRTRLCVDQTWLWLLSRSHDCLLWLVERNLWGNQRLFWRIPPLCWPHKNLWTFYTFFGISSLWFPLLNRNKSGWPPHAEHSLRNRFAGDLCPRSLLSGLSTSGTFQSGLHSHLCCDCEPTFPGPSHLLLWFFLHNFVSCTCSICNIWIEEVPLVFLEDFWKLLKKLTFDLPSRKLTSIYNHLWT